MKIKIEILARMKDSNGKTIYPDVFTDIASQTGYIMKMDYVILENSFEYLRKINGQFENINILIQDQIISNNQENYCLILEQIRELLKGNINNIDNLSYQDIEKYLTILKCPNISINLNSDTFLDENFLDHIQKLLNIYKYKIDPTQITLELSDIKSIINYNKINEIFANLKKLGFIIAIDDFPSGYNNLYQLMQFSNFDIIKFDGQYLKEMYKICHACKDLEKCSKLYEDTFHPENICTKKTELTDIYKKYITNILNMRSSSSNNELIYIEDKIVYDLESWFTTINFIKKCFPKVQLYAEKVENISVYNFLTKCPDIKGYQGYADFFSKPVPLFEGVIISTGKRSIHIENIGLSISNQDKVKEKFVNNIHILTPSENLEIFFQGLNKLTQNFKYSEILKCEEIIKEYYQNFASIENNNLNKYTNKLKNIINFNTLEAIQIILNFFNTNIWTFFVRSSLGFEKEKIILINVYDNGDINFQEKYISLHDIRITKEDYNLSQALKSVQNGNVNIFTKPIVGEGHDIIIMPNPNIIIGMDNNKQAIDFSFYKSQFESIGHSINQNYKIWILEHQIRELEKEKVTF